MRHLTASFVFAGLVLLQAPRAEAQQLVVQEPIVASPTVVDDGRSQGGLDASVGLFISGAVLGTLGTGAAWGFLFPAFGCAFGGSDCEVYGWLSAAGFISWGVGLVLIITAAIVHGVSRGRPQVVRVGETDLRLWTATNDLGTSVSGLQLAF